MKVEQTVCNGDGDWINDNLPGTQCRDAQLVIVFGATDLLEKNKISELNAAYPKAEIIGCASGNEIWGTVVTENMIVVTALSFANAKIRIAKTCIKNKLSSEECGLELITELPKEELKHIFVLIDGIKIDGTKLLEAMVAHLPAGVGLTGGLASDGIRLQKTPVYFEGKAQEGCAVAVGFYGDSLDIAYACEAGWKAYGMERVVTRAQKNILYELDNIPALTLYKDFIGPFADRLPLIGSRYPLSVKFNANDKAMARAIFAINEKDQSISLCADIPVGSLTRFMMTNIGLLLKGAETAAIRTKSNIPSENGELALLLSCGARLQVLQQRVEDEIEIVRDILGNEVIFAGFYSYGEISPSVINEKCYLHNQSMAITIIREQ